MTVYIVARITIDDRKAYAKYEQGFMEVFSLFDGSLLSVEESPHILEGDWSCTRTVLIAFPTRDMALAWYNSPEYRAILPHRHAGAKAQIAILNGLTAPTT
ncbi:MAG: DUF1330 domain-containing protein [Alphaproteobacteria bacterium]|nr:DUF1330 domain-containing protein [Alphaproteobacteria bacterium]MBU2085830.1 DUF1330 domain-containing protein [Alphaproteobacteria bacterium]MBU2141906.1 DUF1330 domain-containing protein [Alphaproteobacteria bacterium]MBU2195284.1 DUF1330 domain-containing protein [Alphaproteobacteria bacterium]